MFIEHCGQVMCDGYVELTISNERDHFLVIVKGQEACVARFVESSTLTEGCRITGTATQPDGYAHVATVVKVPISQARAFLLRKKRDAEIIIRDARKDVRLFSSLINEAD